MNIKNLHEKVRELIDATEEEKYEIRGKTKNFRVIQRYTRNSNDELEEVFVSSPEISISLIISSKGSSVTIVKHGKIEGKSLSEEETKKIIDEITKLLSS